MAVWPSGKAVDCKSSIPSSNLGAAFKNVAILLPFLVYYDIILIRSCWERGGIGRHDRLKICCLVIDVRVQVPPFPLYNYIIVNF